MLGNGSLTTQSRNLGLMGSAGLKRRAQQRKKCNESRIHRESDDDLTSGQNVSVLIRDRVFDTGRPVSWPPLCPYCVSA
jgi:hypothetical protein